MTGLRDQGVVRGAAGTAGLGFAAAMIAIGWRNNHHPWWAFAVAESVGVSFQVAGLIAWWRRPRNPTGRLMVAVGAAWYLTELQASGNALLFAVGYWLTYLPLVIVVHLALAYPEGRLRRRPERVAVAAAYALYLALQGVRYLQDGTGDPIGWQERPRQDSPWADALSLVALGYSALTFVWIARRLLAAGRPARRVHAPVWLGMLVTDLVVAANAAASVRKLAPPVLLALLLAFGLCLLALPFAFLSGLLRVRLARQRVAELVLELERSPEPGRLRPLLAGALDDPSLALGFWSQRAAAYVDVEGRPVALPGPGAARAATFVAGRDGRLAVLVHDPALVEQRVLVQAVVAAARLALENAHLQAVLAARVAELGASRARLAEAALVERRRIERDLHDGVQQRLLRLAWLAERAGGLAGGGDAARLLDQLAREARDTQVELRALARGIHPPVLTERGLAAAVEEHALDAPLPVLVDLPRDRWPEPVEATAFFVISEALANAAKHARAGRVTVRGRRHGGWLAIEIEDDGVGGADPERGSGLRGLADRVGAVGGALAVGSPGGRGTRVVVKLPCE